jgi:hypothetical protein
VAELDETLRVLFNATGVKWTIAQGCRHDDPLALTVRFSSEDGFHRLFTRREIRELRGVAIGGMVWTIVDAYKQWASDGWRALQLAYE